MNPHRVLAIVGVSCALAIMAPQASAAQCGQVNTTVTITLDDNQETQQSGEQLGAFPCWMPKHATTIKNLCADYVDVPHDFRIVLQNQCAIGVRLRLRLQGGGSLQFTGCGDGAVLFDDVVGAGATQPVDCRSRTYPRGSGRKRTEYVLTATHVVQAGGQQPVAPPVEYDPEIAIEDRAGFAMGRIALVVGGLLLLALLGYYLRVRRRSA